MRRGPRLIFPKRIGQRSTKRSCTQPANWEPIHSMTADLRPIWRNGRGLQLEYAYGKYLLFVSDRHPDLLKRPPAERINRNTIADYIKWQPTSCGGVTLGNYIYHLWMILRYICPDENWSWLLTISKRISAQAKRKPEKHHLVTSETLYKLGVDLMDRVVTRV